MMSKAVLCSAAKQAALDRRPSPSDQLHSASLGLNQDWDFYYDHSNFGQDNNKEEFVKGVMRREDSFAQLYRGSEVTRNAVDALAELGPLTSDDEDTSAQDPLTFTDPSSILSGPHVTLSAIPASVPHFPAPLHTKRPSRLRNSVTESGKSSTGVSPKVASGSQRAPSLRRQALQQGTSYNESVYSYPLETRKRGAGSPSGSNQDKPSVAGHSTGSPGINNPVEKSGRCSKECKSSNGACQHCGETSSPQWRKGPPDKPHLCNACGTRFLRTGSLHRSASRRRGGPRRASPAKAAKQPSPSPQPPSSPLASLATSETASEDGDQNELGLDLACGYKRAREEVEVLEDQEVEAEGEGADNTNLHDDSHPVSVHALSCPLGKSNDHFGFDWVDGGLDLAGGEGVGGWGTSEGQEYVGRGRPSEDHLVVVPLLDAGSIQCVSDREGLAETWPGGSGTEAVVQSEVPYSAEHLLSVLCA